MIVIVDERPVVHQGFVSWFQREGVAASGFQPGEFKAWMASAGEADIRAVEGYLLGAAANRIAVAEAIRMTSSEPLIGLNDEKSLEETLGLLAAGADDVVRKPVHVRELLARISAIRRRARDDDGTIEVGGIRVFADGRDPQVLDGPLPLPRRERRILEFLVRNRGCRVTKTQIYNTVYGLFGQDIAENVIESHISKLRKRLRDRLGYDPIDSQRFLGYRLMVDDSTTMIGAGRLRSKKLAPEREMALGN
jgi:DNA-binding response OmpR family regulator